MTGGAPAGAPLPPFLADDYVSRRRQLAAQPGPLWIEAGMVVSYIDALRGHGLTMREIARISRRSVGQLQNLRYQRQCSRQIAIAVWAIPMPASPGVAASDRVPGVFAQRLIQSWRVQGWTWDQMAARTGVTIGVLQRLAFRGGRLYARTERLLRVSIREMRQADPVAECGKAAFAAREAAQLAGWRPLWQYARPDDPACVPEATVKQERMCLVVSQVAQWAADGMTRREIASAAGLAWETIRTYHYRTGARLPEVRNEA